MAAIESQTTSSRELVRTWFAAYRDDLVRYARRRVGAGDAEDVASEVLTRAMTAAARLDARDAKPWLFGIAANVIAEHRRSERRQWAVVERMASSVNGSPSHDSDSVRLPARLVRALSELPGGQREALLLVVWGELSYDECASALSIPVGTVRSRIARARLALQEALEQEQGGRQ